MRFLWRFFRRRFLRLWVAIFFLFRFFPEPIDAWSFPFHSLTRPHRARTGIDPTDL